MGMEIGTTSDGRSKWPLCDVVFDIIIEMLDNGIELSHHSYWLNDM